MRLFHPLDDHYGFSPIEAAATAIDLHNQASKWNKALLDNAARPSGALVYSAREGRLSPEQFERLKAELQEGFQGAKNAGRPLLLEGGLDWKPLSLSPKDMDFIEAKHAAAREIALALGVPPMLLGIPGDNTFSNYAEANRTFWRNTVVPLVSRAADSLSDWLGPAFSQTPLKLAPDLDEVEALAPEREALWARLEKTSFLTNDEKRAVIGYGPLPAPKFNPGQTRVPAGRPGGGRWGNGPSGSGGGGTTGSDFGTGNGEGGDGGGGDAPSIDPAANDSPQADPSEWPTWDNPDIIPVADKPQFSPDKFGWHDYSVGPSLICGSELKCSAQEMADQLSRYGVPGQDPARPVQDGEIYPVYDPRNGVFAGFVKTTVSEDGLSITNRTQAEHVLYDGQITRQALQAADGSWYVYTRGTGNNGIPGFNVLNEWQGPEVFRALDRNLRDNISRHHGVSRQ
jgi:hypothetical protein